jgi:hypothetical protein
MARNRLMDFPRLVRTQGVEFLGIDIGVNAMKMANKHQFSRAQRKDVDENMLNGR